MKIAAVAFVRSTCSYKPLLMICVHHVCLLTYALTTRAGFFSWRPPMALTKWGAISKVPLNQTLSQQLLHCSNSETKKTVEWWGMCVCNWEWSRVLLKHSMHAQQVAILHFETNSYILWHFLTVCYCTQDPKWLYIKCRLQPISK